MRNPLVSIAKVLEYANLEIRAWHPLIDYHSSLQPNKLKSNHSFIEKVELSDN